MILTEQKSALMFKAILSISLLRAQESKTIEFFGAERKVRFPHFNFIANLPVRNDHKEGHNNPKSIQFNK